MKEGDFYFLISLELWGWDTAVQMFNWANGLTLRFPHPDDKERYFSVIDGWIE